MTTSDTGSIHHQKRQSADGVAKAFKVSSQLYSCVIGLPRCGLLLCAVSEKLAGRELHLWSGLLPYSLNITYCKK